MASPRRPLPGAFAVVLTLLSQLALVGACAAADAARQLSFTWPQPTPGSPCDLRDPGVDQRREPLRLTGTVASSGFGVACTVQIARRRFDALYRFCTVTNVDSVPREHYACWVMYSPTHVTFLYSYTDDLYGAPACEFACSPR